MERKGEVFNDFDGLVFKRNTNWLVTTTVPSISSAKVVDTKLELREGMPVKYDLVAILSDEHTEYEAINLRRRDTARSPKPTPKQRDRNRNRANR